MTTLRAFSIDILAAVTGSIVAGLVLALQVADIQRVGVLAGVAEGGKCSLGAPGKVLNHRPSHQHSQIV